MKYSQKTGQPTAVKSKGAEWYYPAVTVAFGPPKVLPHGDRCETRAKAKSAAKQILDAAMKGKPE